MKHLLGKTGILAAVLLLALPLAADAQTTESGAAVQPGQIDEQSLGNLLRAMGLKPTKEKQRYDFRFKAILNGEEWELSMSAVLSQNKQTIWVMAWLDELPKSAADVPRTALLRLLADNDRLGKGKFFAYVASNRRFVLQRVVVNRNVSTASFRDVLKDLGATVVVTYPHWSVANWNGGSSQQGTAARTASQTTNPAPQRASLRNSKFAPTRRN